MTFTLLLSETPTKAVNFWFKKVTSKGNVWCVGVLHSNVSQILTTVDASRGEIARKTLSVIWDVNFCGTFIAIVLLILKLARSNLARILLYSPGLFLSHTT